MRYKLLGKSGLRVSELCLGAMTFGDIWSLGANVETSKQVFDTFVSAGGNFIDTAVNYTAGHSETILGEFVKADREHFVIATKFVGTSQEQTDPNQGGSHRKNMMHSVERSLKRLQTDYIDLYYVHVWDNMTPIQETMRALDDLVSAGKVHYVAISDAPSWGVAEANTRAELMGWTQFVGFQLPYSLAQRDIERNEIPLCKHWDMALLPWGMLAGGLLTGKYRQTSDEPRRRGADQENERERRIVDAVLEIAAETGTSASQVALNWVRQQQDRAVIIPIIGSRTPEQLEDNLNILNWTLSPEHMARLNEVSAIEYGFPRDLVERDVLPYVYGVTYDQIDNHRGKPVW